MKIQRMVATCRENLKDNHVGVITVLRKAMLPAGVNYLAFHVRRDQSLVSFLADVRRLMRFQQRLNHSQSCELTSPC